MSKVFEELTQEKIKELLIEKSREKDNEGLVIRLIELCEDLNYLTELFIYLISIHYISVNVYKKILEKGIDINNNCEFNEIKDIKYITVSNILHIIILESRSELLELVLTYESKDYSYKSVNINIQDEEGHTVLENLIIYNTLENDSLEGDISMLILLLEQKNIIKPGESKVNWEDLKKENLEFYNILYKDIKI